jgi:D-galactarolactone isomerase
MTMAGLPKLKTPQGATDTHMHIYDLARFTPRPGVAPPPDAPVAAYRQLQRRLGLQRVVIVQPNAYGDDNRCTLDAMAQLAPNARGVAVVTHAVADAELRRLTDAGIRGLRYVMFPGGFHSWDTLDLAARVAEFGWHAQVQFDGRELPERKAALMRLPGRFVIDHVGKFVEPVAPDHPGFRALLDLVATGRCWVKLSGPYETSKSGPPLFADVGALAKALIRAAPERMLWASNWPHPSVQEKPDDAMLLDVLLDWAPDEATRRKILVDNPAELYGF